MVSINSKKVKVIQIANMANQVDEAHRVRTISLR